MKKAKKGRKMHILRSKKTNHDKYDKQQDLQHKNKEISLSVPT